MAYYKIKTFNGIAPQVSPRLLQDTIGQTANDVDLDKGVLSPITDNSKITDLAGVGKTSIYKYTYSSTDYWLEWTNDVDVQPGPIADDALVRVYWSGDGFPKMGTATEVAAAGSGAYPRNYYRLGIPAPTAAPTLSVTGTDDGTQTQYSTAYVYTFVSAYGEEGPPSPVSSVVTKVDAQSVDISGLETTAGSGAGRTNTNLTAKRIYRSNTGSNTTAFQFVKEVSLATASTTDSTTNANLAELIPSTYWIGPPNEDTSLYPNGQMKGLTAMPNGIFAGFTGKRVCFSEPYLPHAWPVAYRLTVEDDIVAIGSTGNGLFVATTGNPYFISGTDPQSMTAIRIEAAQTCLNKRSFVDMGPYVMYASPGGLVMAAGTDVQLATGDLIDSDYWQDNFYPSTIQGFRLSGKYLGFYASEGNYGGFIFDPRGGKNAFTTLSLTSSTQVSGGYVDSNTNKVYLIQDDDVKQFQGGSTNQTITFKTKEFVTNKPTSMGFVKVEAEAYTGSGITVKVYGDGTLIYNATITTSGSSYSVTGSSPTSFSATTIPEPILRLPSGVHKTFSVQVEGAHTINEICIAESIDELKAV
jgi:hypothetical protein